MDWTKMRIAYEQTSHYKNREMVSQMQDFYAQFWECGVEIPSYSNYNLVRLSSLQSGDYFFFHKPVGEFLDQTCYRFRSYSQELGTGDMLIYKLVT